MVIRPQFTQIMYETIRDAVKEMEGAIVYAIDNVTVGDRLYDISIDGVAKNELSKVLKDIGVDKNCTIKKEKYKNKITNIIINTLTILPIV